MFHHFTWLLYYNTTRSYDIVRFNVTHHWEKHIDRGECRWSNSKINGGTEMERRRKDCRWSGPPNDGFMECGTKCMPTAKPIGNPPHLVMAFSRIFPKQVISSVAHMKAVLIGRCRGCKRTVSCWTSGCCVTWTGLIRPCHTRKVYIPRTSGCAKLSLEVETTLFSAVWDIFCSFPNITPFHGWGFVC